MIFIQQKNEHCLTMKLPAIVLSAVFLVISCAPTLAPTLQTGALNTSPGTVALIVFVDNQFKTIETGENFNHIVSFYNWIFDGFRYKTKEGVILFADKTVVSNVIAKGIKPIVLYDQNNPKRDIIHLSFDETQIDELNAVAEQLGATHLVKARLIKSETRKIPRNQITSGPISLGPFILNIPVTLSGNFDQTMRDTTVEFTIYDVKTKEIILTKEFTSSKISMGMPDAQIKANLTAAVIAGLKSNSADLSHQQENVQNTFRMATIRIPRIEDGHYYIRSMVMTLRSITLIHSNLIRFDGNFKNNLDEKLKIVLRRSANNKLSTYIVDHYGIRYDAVSSSLPNDSFDIRPKEQKDIFFVFPITATPHDRVDLYSVWDIQTPQKNHTATLEFRDIPIP